MAISDQPAPLRVAAQHRAVSGWLLAGLLFLRLPFWTGIALFAHPTWLDPVFQVGTYLLTAVLIWHERQALADFHLDTLAVAIIVLFKPLQTLILRWAYAGLHNSLTFPGPYSLAIWAIALGLLAALRASKASLPRIRKADFRLLGIGILAGAATAILLSFPMSFQVRLQPHLTVNQPLLLQLLQVVGMLLVPTGFLYQMGFAAVTEEPLFRGFLWGQLRQRGWQERWIWLAQAGLFSLGHLYYWSVAPISFWLIVPVAALMLGWLAWRTRSLVTTLGAHAALNALGYGVGYLVAVIRAAT